MKATYPEKIELEPTHVLVKFNSSRRMYPHEYRKFIRLLRENGYVIYEHKNKYEEIMIVNNYDVVVIVKAKREDSFLEEINENNADNEVVYGHIEPDDLLVLNRGNRLEVWLRMYNVDVLTVAKIPFRPSLMLSADEKLLDVVMDVGEHGIKVSTK